MIYHTSMLAWAHLHRKPNQTEPHRTKPKSRFFCFWFRLRFFLSVASVFGFGFGFRSRKTDEPRKPNKPHRVARPCVHPHIGKSPPSPTHINIGPNQRCSRTASPQPVSPPPPLGHTRDSTSREQVTPKPNPIASSRRREREPRVAAERAGGGVASVRRRRGRDGGGVTATARRACGFGDGSDEWRPAQARASGEPSA